jgi:hypothetical protein
MGWRSVKGGASATRSSTEWLGVDPYGDCDDLPAEADCVGREGFAVDPLGRIAVHAEDIPDEIWILLEAKRREANAEGWREVLSAVRRTS